MINENKVKLLTKIASFEHQMKKNRQELDALTKSKYVGKGIFWSIVTSSVAFVLIILLRAHLKSSLKENLISFSDGNLSVLNNRLIWLIYILYEVFFIILSWVFYTSKYNKIKDKLEEYFRRQSNYDEFYNQRDSESE